MYIIKENKVSRPKRKEEKKRHNYSYLSKE
jgi:hypothetical protein